MAVPNVQSYDLRIVRASAVLTTSYVAGTTIDNVEHYNQLMVYFDFTLGSLTSAQVKVEFSDDGENYYQETFSSVSAGTSTDTLGEHSVTATGLYVLAIPIKCSRIKISVKGTGTVTSSLMKVNAVVAVQ